ncbi:MAG: sigma-70 family RNA polymerase sigma factor [Clostridia bacterium]
MSENRCYRDLSEEEQNGLWEKCAAGDEKSRRLLLQLNEPLVRAVVSRFAFEKDTAEDLFQSGMVGLLCALERFDPKRGVSFGTFAFPYIKGEVVKSLAEMKGEKKTFYQRKWKEMAARGGSAKAAAARASVSLEEWMEEAETTAFSDLRAEEMFDAAENRLWLKEVVASLGTEEKRLLYYRYILRKSQAETGKALSLSQTRISRKEKEILAGLRERI